MCPWEVVKKGMPTQGCCDAISAAQEAAGYGEAELCQFQGVHTETCDSYAMCSMTPMYRYLLTRADAPWWNRSIHQMGDHGLGVGQRTPPGARLLVPIQKLAPVEAVEARAAAKQHPAYARWGLRPSHNVGDVEATATAVAAAPYVWRAWPARGQFDEHVMPWERFPEGELWSRCRTGNHAHWYCNHISSDYFGLTQAVYDDCIEPLGIFKRPDVRLVVDLGGGTGAFAEAVFKWHADRVVVVTTQLLAAENDHTYGHQFPQVGTLAARGYLGVTMDLYAHFPFGESSLDAVHTSWTFHNGFPRTTLYEVHRVLRPGGYFIIRQMANTQGGLRLVRRFGSAMNWTIIHDKLGCLVRLPRHSKPFGDTILVFRMPLPPTWRQSVFSAKRHDAPGAV
jgi:SAM-dependent methyltransferase